MKTVLALAFCLTGMAALAQDSDQPIAVGEADEIVLVDVPMPDLEELKPEIRALIEPAIVYFNKRKDQLDGPELGRSYGRLGMHFQAHAMLDAAHAAYRNAALLDPRNYRWTYLLAVNFDESGEASRAVALYATSLGLNQANLAARTRLSLVLLRQGHYDEAERHLQQVLKNNNRDAAALAGLGLIAFEREQYQRSISYFLRALESDPLAGQIHYHIAMSYRAIGDVDQAQEHLDQYNPRIPVIEDRLLALVIAHRIGAGQYADTGSALMKEGRYQEAVKMFEFSTAINPEYLPSFIALAQGYRYLKNDDMAYESIDKAIATDPDDAFANYIKASWLDQDGQLSESVPYYQAALASMPDYVQARMLLANALMMLGQYEDASEQYGEILALNDQHITAMYLYGISNLATGNCGEAMRLVETALGSNQENSRILSVQARIYATCPAATDEQKRQAVEVAQNLYDAQPVADTAVTLAMALAATGDFDQAVEFQAQAMFEAIRDQQEERHLALAENMERYRQQQAATQAWSAADPLYTAPRNIRRDPVPVTANAPVDPPQEP